MAAATRPRVTIGLGYRYDSVYLRNGTCTVPGFDIKFEPDLPPEGQGTGAGERVIAGGRSYVAPAPIFTAMATDPPYDVGELAFATFVQAFDHGTPIVGIPVFTSRYFEHNQLFVRSGSGVQTPADLDGKRVSIGCWGMNPSVWVRGMLCHQYDVPLERITWIMNRPEYFADRQAPRRYAVEKIGEDESVPALVEAGRIDAVSRGRASATTQPMFENPYPEIRDYFAATGVFPPNTVLAIRRDRLEKSPDLPQALFETFTKALDLYRDELARGSRNEDHSGLDVQRLEREAGVRFPDYGFTANAQSIRMVIQYCYEQGVIERLYAPEDLFVLTDS
jgi:4,5-dihydroxyphthalate decarboxylase